MIPLSRPALVTLFLFAFIGEWNDLFKPLVFTTRPELRTAQLALAEFQEQFTNNWPLLMAAVVISTIPMVLLFFWSAGSSSRHCHDWDSRITNVFFLDLEADSAFYHHLTDSITSPARFQAAESERKLGVLRTSIHTADLPDCQPASKWCSDGLFQLRCLINQFSCCVYTARRSSSSALPSQGISLRLGQQHPDTLPGIEPQSLPV